MFPYLPPITHLSPLSMCFRIKLIKLQSRPKFCFCPYWKDRHCRLNQMLFSAWWLLLGFWLRVMLTNWLRISDLWLFLKAWDLQSISQQFSLFQLHGFEQLSLEVQEFQFRPACSFTKDWTLRAKLLDLPTFSYIRSTALTVLNSVVLKWSVSLYILLLITHAIASTHQVHAYMTSTSPMNLNQVLSHQQVDSPQFLQSSQTHLDSSMLNLWCHSSYQLLWIQTVSSLPPSQH